MNQHSLPNQFNQWIGNERAKLLALLISKIKDFERAEDCLQEASIKALQHWSVDGFPANPHHWILKTAYNKAIDGIRREINFANKQERITLLQEQCQRYDGIDISDEIPDQRLKLIFTCCHPALDPQTQVALTLNTVCGLSVEEVARSFIVSKTTMAQRLVRAKRKIRISNIPYKEPGKKELSPRLEAVLSVIYLIYNLGYSDSSFNTQTLEHTQEAFYLLETLNELIPNQPEVLGLLSLLHFHQSRFESRRMHRDQLVTLENQDRNLWDQKLIGKANDYFKQAMGLKSLGPYQIQAAISGVHSQAKSFEETDWKQIVSLYGKLYEHLATDTVLINQSVALSYNQQHQQALELIQSIDASKLETYLPYHLAKAHIYKSLRQKHKAINNLSLAMALAKDHKEKSFIQSQIELLELM